MKSPAVRPVKMLLTRHAGPAGRAKPSQRLVKARLAVARLREALMVDREELLAEIDFLACRARVSGNKTAGLMLSAVAEAMRGARAHEMLGAMLTSEERRCR